MVRARAAMAPKRTPAAVSRRPRERTRRSRLAASAPRAMRNPSSRVLWATADDITP